MINRIMATPLIQRYDKARNSCALFHMENWGVFRLRGSDVRDYLQRISTADVKTLAPGAAVQTLFLQGDGRMVADTVVYCAAENDWYLVCSGVCRELLAAQLDKYLFTEDVKVYDLSGVSYTGIFLGPKSPVFLEHLEQKCLPIADDGFAVITTIAPAARRGLVFIPHEKFADVKTCMYSWLEENEGVIGDLDLYNTFRIESGCPLWGVELTEKTIPLEAGQKPAISFTKGCFPGQEIVARINNLGHPANVLVGLRTPETTEKLIGSELTVDGKTVGAITSLCYSPLLKGPLALGFVKWALREPGTSVQIGRAGGHNAEVVELPVPGSEV